MLPTLWLSQPLLSQPLSYGIKPPHLQCALQYVGTKEAGIGKNRGQWIDVWNKYVGNKLGSPYCAAFVSWNIGQTSAIEPRIKTGLARNFIIKAPRYLTYTAGSVLRGKAAVHYGDIVIWGRGSTIYGHAGIAVYDWVTNSGWTIEGNTSKGSAGSQSEGDGVFMKYRKIEPYNYFRIIGFCRVRY